MTETDAALPGDHLEVTDGILARDMVAYSYATAAKLCNLCTKSIERATQRDPGPGRLRPSHYDRIPRSELIRWMHSGYAIIPRTKKSAPKKRKRFPRVNP